MDNTTTIQNDTKESAKRNKRPLSERLFGGDRALWIIIATLAVVSILVVYSSTASMAYRKAGGDTTHYVMNQIKFIVLGFGCMFAVHRIPYQLYARFAKLGFIMALGFMALTFFIGVNLNDASRWIRIPIVGLTFQPSDFLKVTLVMVLAQQLAKRQTIIDRIPILPSFNPADWSAKNNKNKDIFFHTTIPLLLPVVLACGAIFFSNFSTAAITFGTCWIMLMIGRVRMRELFRLLAAIIIPMIFILGVMAAAGVGRAQTWVNRLKDFVGTEQVEQDSDDNLQVRQAKIAIATGGIFGKGPGNSTQRANLPHSYSDFAYAFIAEEYGVMGAAVVLILYLWIFFRAILIFQKCGTAFPSFLVLGLSLMITMQALCNMLVSVNLFPVTGQALPLISLGGSSLLFTSIALGMILGVSRQVQEKTLDKPKGESLLESNK